MATTTRTTTTRTTTTRAATSAPSPRVFLTPDRALADVYTPTRVVERAVERDAITPTLRLWARALMGRARDPEPAVVVYATVEALRVFLQRDLARRRPGHIVSQELLAHVWWRVLDDDERAVLQTLAERGEVEARARCAAPVERRVEQRVERRDGLWSSVA